MHAPAHTCAQKEANNDNRTLKQGAAVLVPLVLGADSASAARDYGSKDCSGYDGGCPLPDTKAQKLWGTRLGASTRV